MSELIYGRHAVLETLRAARREFYRLWLDESAKDSDTLAAIQKAAASMNLPAKSVRGGLFDKLTSQHANHQGVALEVGDYAYVDMRDILTPVDPSHADGKQLSPLILVLDHVQDPQNLGTLLRTAEAMAVQGVIIPERRSAGVTPAVVNASAGAIERLAVARVTNINRAIEDLQENSFWVAGLDDSDDASPPDARTLQGSLAVVVGNEGEGISRLTREKCDFLVRLPMYGQIESLNASVAGSILLYLIRHADPNA